MSTTPAVYLDLFGNPRPEPKTVVILSLGMGVESVAILVRWIMEPDTCPCALSDLLVITAQVGDEYEDTKWLMETFLLPRLRKHGIRYVQVARAGALQEDGIVVLDDSREPVTCFLKGHFKLSDEMRINGTIPITAKPHTCAMKHKAWTIEEWLNQNVRGSITLQHAFGYNAKEPDRIESSEYATELRNRERIAFGYNRDETSRIGVSCEYNTVTRIAFYPLLDWDWDRQKCLEYIFSVFGVWWKKSACVYCPFCARTPEQLERQAAHPDQLIEALTMEYVALCFNPRAKLYKSKSLFEVTAQHNPALVQKFQAALEQRNWALYRIRRLFSPKREKKTGLVNRQKRGTVFRCLERIGEYPTHFAALEALLGYGAPERHNGIPYVFRQKKGTVFPCKEELYTVAPAKLEDKARYGIPWFNAKWGAYDINLFEKEEEGDEEAA